jgi:hypothetical protein
LFRQPLIICRKTQNTYLYMGRRVIARVRLRAESHWHWLVFVCNGLFVYVLSFFYHYRCLYLILHRLYSSLSASSSPFHLCCFISTPKWVCFFSYPRILFLTYSSSLSSEFEMVIFTHLLIRKTILLPSTSPLSLLVFDTASSLL